MLNLGTVVVVTTLVCRQQHRTIPRLPRQQSVPSAPLECSTVYVRTLLYSRYQHLANTAEFLRSRVARTRYYVSSKRTEIVLTLQHVSE